MEPTSINLKGSELPILVKALSDEKFRQQLPRNRRPRLREAFGIEIAKEVKIYVHESTDTDIHLVLPENRSIDLELAPIEKASKDVRDVLRLLSLTVGKAIGVVPAIPAGMYDWRI